MLGLRLPCNAFLLPQIDLNSLMKDIVDITKFLVGRKVQLVDNVGDLPAIIGDGDRIVQIMYNLIGNAGECGRSCGECGPQVSSVDSFPIRYA